MFYGQGELSPVSLLDIQKSARKKAAKQRRYRRMLAQQGVDQAISLTSVPARRRAALKVSLRQINALNLSQLIQKLKTTRNALLRKAIKARIAQLQRKQARAQRLSQGLGALSFQAPTGPFGALSFQAPTGPFGALSEDGMLVYNGLGGAHGGDYEYGGMLFDQASANLPLLLGVYAAGSLMVASKMKKKSKKSKQTKAFLNLSGIVAAALVADHYLFPSQMTVIEKIEEVAVSGLG